MSSAVTPNVTEDRGPFPAKHHTYGWTAKDGAPVVVSLWLLFLLNPYFTHLKHCSSRREEAVPKISSEDFATW